MFYKRREEKKKIFINIMFNNERMIGRQHDNDDDRNDCGITMVKENFPG